MQAAQEITPNAAQTLLNQLEHIEDRLGDIHTEADFIVVTGPGVDTESLVN